jgi:predicted amidohydrolase YtcJ
MAAAAHRTTPAGRTVGATERISVREALAGYLGSPEDPGGQARRVQVGAPADLVLLHVPLAEALEHPSSDLVGATLVDGVEITGH